MTLRNTQTFSRATLLGLLLAVASVASAQVTIPSTPPPLPSPVEPVQEQSQPEAPLSDPPLPPDEMPEPAEPAQPEPPAPLPETANPATRAVSQAPMLIQVVANYPALIDGQKSTVPFISNLVIPSERASQIRQRGIITTSLEQDLQKFVTTLPGPVDARFEDIGGRWAVVQRNGLKVDLAATRQNVLNMIKAPDGVQTKVVIAGQVAPKRTLDFFLSRGITTFYASGQTSYYGSSQDRVTNIHVGAKNFKDRLFEGKLISFNQMIGPVSTRNGYVAGLVIAGDQTASGVGGGICQVSTTVFRALYGAGFPIVQRQNHSYQVHYYDPQGLDATIYQPTLDLKFTNDSGGALWFQTDWDDEESILTVSVFGKARNLNVYVDPPRTIKTTPAPPDRLIYDRTLPAGQRKQIDWAAPGALIEVTRRFVVDGKEIKRDVLKSSYRPWPNIFRVGTGARK